MLGEQPQVVQPLDYSSSSTAEAKKSEAQHVEVVEEVFALISLTAEVSLGFITT